jgi:hypothetical protein
MRAILGILATAALAMCVSAESQATLVKWTLNDVTFSDGAGRLVSS